MGRPKKGRKLEEDLRNLKRNLKEATQKANILRSLPWDYPNCPSIDS